MDSAQSKPSVAPLGRDQTGLTPLEMSALRDCAKRGSTRCNDGGMVDTLLSGLCSKPTCEDPYVRWSMNPKSRDDGYIGLYTPTPRGFALVAAEADTPK